jgi:hypothetical protein
MIAHLTFDLLSCYCVQPHHPTTKIFHIHEKSLKGQERDTASIDKNPHEPCKMCHWQLAPTYNVHAYMYVHTHTHVFDEWLKSGEECLRVQTTLQRCFPKDMGYLHVIIRYPNLMLHLPGKAKYQLFVNRWFNSSKHKNNHARVYQQDFLQWCKRHNI